MVETRSLEVVFRTLDPDTGDLPEDVFAGFLPPEDGTGRGQGHFIFSIRTKPSTPDGVIIWNEASVVFDVNAPIHTNSVFNTIGPIPTPTALPSPSPTPIITPTPACLHHGDVNNDQNITSNDALLTFEIALGVTVPTYQEACSADCNGDESITALDAQMVFLAALGSGSCVDPLE